MHDGGGGWGVGEGRIGDRRYKMKEIQEQSSCLVEVASHRSVGQQPENDRFDGDEDERGEREREEGDREEGGFFLRSFQSTNSKYRLAQKPNCRMILTPPKSGFLSPVTPHG